MAKIVMPDIARKLVNDFDAWIVGGGADPDITEQPRDWDVMVPFREWDKAAHLIHEGAVPNTFGGWKMIENVNPLSSGVDYVIDVWPGALERILTHPKCRWAWHPRSGSRVRVQRDETYNVN